MASYVNITLDNTGVTPLMVTLNSDETRTGSTAVTLSVFLADADKEYADNYTMCILGDVVSSGEWEKFAYEKTVVLTDGDGLKEVFVIIRDDLLNEGDAVSDTITLYTTVPTVTVAGPTIARISTNEGKDVTTFTFTADKSIEALKVMAVENINVLHDDATSKLMPVTNGSKITVTNEAGESVKISSDTGLSLDLGGLVAYSAGREFTVTVYGLDLYEASPDDGVKIIKVFVRERDGNWSV